MEEAMANKDTTCVMRGLIHDLTISLTASFVHLDNLMIEVDKNNDLFDELWLANDQLERSLEFFLELRSLYLMVDLDKTIIVNNKDNIFVNSLINNINNLLTVIVGCCDIIYETDDGNKNRKYIEMIYNKIGKSGFINPEGFNNKQISHDSLNNTLKFRSSIHNINILLVEDDEVLREFIFNALQNEGFTIIQCKDGENAIAEFKTHKSIIDICLVDYELPDMNGCKLVEQILSIKNNTNIMFMSGYSDLDLTVANSNRKFSLIRKPFKLNYMIEQVEKVLN